MNIILNAIVLIYEVLYYALFMKFARKDGKFWKYILLFSLITICLFFITTNKIYSILMLCFAILYGLKIIVKINVSLFDLLVIFAMLLIKLIVEMPLSLLFYTIIKNIFVVSTITGIIKIFIVVLIRNNINRIYNKFEKLWKNNNFYIRYIFTILMFTYIICTCLFFIIKWI